MTNNNNPLRVCKNCIYYIPVGKSALLDSCSYDENLIMYDHVRGEHLYQRNKCKDVNISGKCRHYRDLWMSY